MGGTDATAVFHSMHALSAQRNMQKLLESHCVGTLQEEDEEDEQKVQFDFHSQFATELKRRVVLRLREQGVRSWYAPTAWWLRFAVIAAALVVCEATWMSSGALWAMVAVGVLHAAVGVCVQHDASHGALSKRAGVNALVSYGADIIGNNRFLWLQQHVVGHHPHCNIKDQDPDVHSAEPFLQFHWAPSAVRHWIARHQALYMFLVLPWYGPTVIFNVFQLATMRHGEETPPNEWTLSHRPTAVALRLFYWLRIIAVPAYLGVAHPLVALLGVPLVTGAVLTFLFIVSHNFEGSDRFPEQKRDEQSGCVDWYRLQVETSCSYGGRLAMMLTGGLNMQIEHHVFPRMNSWYYPVIQDTVRDVCRKYGVKYTHFPSLSSNVVSMLRYISSVGSLEKEEQQAEETKAKKGSDAQHNMDDAQCFIVIEGKRLNVTHWMKKHPGGSEIIEMFNERDATEQFEAMHSEEAKVMLSKMLRSTALAKPLTEEQAAAQKEARSARSVKLMAAFATLKEELRSKGFFETPLWYEAGRLVLLLSAYVVGAMMMKMTSWVWSGALLYSLAMQQSGWLSHDYLHHSVLRSVRWNDAMGGFLGWLQGYDSLWWKFRHNLHHVATNEEHNDPDIDIAPLLTYISDSAERNVVLLNWLQKWQHVYFIPLLSALHLSWLFSSLEHVVRLKMWPRVALLGVHHVWMIWLFCIGGEFRLKLFLFAMLFKGMLTAIFVFSTHYPEVRVPPGAAGMSLVEQTVRTSRNIVGRTAKGTPFEKFSPPDWLVDYLSGNISRQVEHHLFPTMPRANLPAVTPYVKAFCAEHKLPYLETGLVECMRANMKCLKHEVAHISKKQKAH